jgi:hypothetical protein
MGYASRSGTLAVVEGAREWEVGRAWEKDVVGEDALGAVLAREEETPWE